MSLVETAVDLTLAQIKRGATTAAAVVQLLETTHQTLLDLARQTAEAQPALDWRASIGLDKVTCMVCGDGFKQITTTHMQTHGITMVAYRRRFSIPPTQSLSSRRTARRRRKIARQSKLSGYLPAASHAQHDMRR